MNYFFQIFHFEKLSVLIFDCYCFVFDQSDHVIWISRLFFPLNSFVLKFKCFSVWHWQFHHRQKKFRNGICQKLEYESVLSKKSWTPTLHLFTMRIRRLPMQRQKLLEKLRRRKSSRKKESPQSKKVGSPNFRQLSTNSSRKSKIENAQKHDSKAEGSDSSWHWEHCHDQKLWRCIRESFGIPNEILEGMRHTGWPNKFFDGNFFRKSRNGHEWRKNRESLFTF